MAHCGILLGYSALSTEPTPFPLFTVLVSTSIDVTPPSRSLRRSRNGVSSIMYTANIRFQYEVNGRAYRSDQIWFGQTAGSGDSSEADLRRFRYPLGEKVTVSYDPADPAIAAVHPGFQAEALWLPGAGLAFLFPGLMAFVMYKSAFTGSGIIRYVFPGDWRRLILSRQLLTVPPCLEPLRPIATISG
jgi:hypothetical protein